MVNVSWNDAVAFCEWLSRQEGQTYRLPTEAEWEYACRAGTTTRYCSGDDAETLAAVANVADATAKAKFPDWATIAARDGYVFTAPVGRFRANAWGLHDMHGNVWEWCSDGYAERLLRPVARRRPARSPPGPRPGDPRRVLVQRGPGLRPVGGTLLVQCVVPGPRRGLPRGPSSPRGCSRGLADAGAPRAGTAGSHPDPGRGAGPAPGGRGPGGRRGPDRRSRPDPGRRHRGLREGPGCPDRRGAPTASSWTSRTSRPSPAASSPGWSMIRSSANPGVA